MQCNGMCYDISGGVGASCEILRKVSNARGALLLARFC
jgi:hypothetical protein